MLNLKPHWFRIGALALLAWFVWNGLTVTSHPLIEWGIFYMIALIAWHPAAVWLSEGARWLPAAELFFLLHIAYYVNGFVSKDTTTNFESESLLPTGVVILAFMVACRIGYRVVPWTGTKGRASRSLDRAIPRRWGQSFAWFGLINFCMWTILLITGGLPDFGSFTNLVRTTVTSTGMIGIIYLNYQSGRRQIDIASRHVVTVVLSVIILFQAATGFLITAAVTFTIGVTAFFLGRRKLPVTAIAVGLPFFFFLQMGKAEMRGAFWSEGGNSVNASSGIVAIYEQWIAASWSKLTGTSDIKRTDTLAERANLLDYVARTVTETPQIRDYMWGETYLLVGKVFTPRFLSVDKARATLPDETLALYYEVQTIESVETTAVGMGRIAEGWANFGWIGIVAAGLVMGGILAIPTWLSHNFSISFRTLLAFPFVQFAMNLEGTLIYGLHSLLTGLAFSIACVWVLSLRDTSDPAAPWKQRAAKGTQGNRRTQSV